ncbi:hypothetical protein BH20ACI2_BH20ACI2_26200 [soil metagenome]
MREQQTYANHVRWFPLVHFVIFPLLTILSIWSIVNLVMTPSAGNLWNLLLIIGVLLLSFAARLQALKAQDRLIRLEEKLRSRALLSEDAYARANRLRTRQMIALRFASDGELGELLEQVLSGEITTSKEIKTAIREWRGDYLRV